MNDMAKAFTAQEVIKALGLSPHPEKGYFIETFRDSHSINDRSSSTCIYYLIEGKIGLSRWHRVLDGVEVWHYHAGAPLQLSLSWDDGEPSRDVILGVDFEKVSFQNMFRSLLLSRLNFIATGSSAAGCRSAQRVATCQKFGRLDTRWMYGGTSLPLRVIRDGWRGMGAPSSCRDFRVK